MATNNGRKVDETSFNQQMRVVNKMANAGTNLFNNVYKAQHQTSNTDLLSIVVGDNKKPGYTFTIQTPKGRLLTGVLLNNNDVGEMIELTDVRIGGDPIIIPTRTDPGVKNMYSKIRENKGNAKILADQYTSGKNNKNITLRKDDKKTIDDYLDERYDTLKKEYLKMFKEYSQARPDQRRAKTNEVAEALIKYNLLNK